MKARTTKCVVLVAALGWVVLPAKADNPPIECTETGPHYGEWSCSQQGYQASYGLSYTNLTVCVGQTFTLPIFSGAIGNGQKTRSATYDCPSPHTDQETATVYYNGQDFFDPPMTNVLWQAGTNYYTNKVIGTPFGDVCSSFTTNLVVVTVTVTASPHTNWYCAQSGTLTNGGLEITNLIVCVGQMINTPPHGTNIAFTDCTLQQGFTYDCTNTITYLQDFTNVPAQSSVYYEPAMTNVWWVAGTYYYTGRVEVTASYYTNLCSYSTNLGVVTVTVQPTNYAGIAAGGYHTLALKSDGTLLAAGLNANGQLGNGNTNNQSSFVSVSYLTNVTAVEAGDRHSLAISNGNVWAWGTNGNGRLGNNSTTESHTPVKVVNVASITAIAAGRSHSLAISNQNVWAWGLNTSGQLGDGTTTSRTKPVHVTNLTSITAIAAGDAHSLALSNGIVWAWGTNANGRLGDWGSTYSKKPVRAATNLDSVMAIAAGGSHSLALKTDGTVWAWGLNSSGQLGNNSTTSSTNRVQVTGLTNAMIIAAGNAHSLAVLSNGTVVAWGDNTAGQLGDNSQVNRKTNVAVIGLSNIVAIAGGGLHSAALQDNGTLWVWGNNMNGQLGFSGGGYYATPVTNGVRLIAPPSITSQPQGRTAVQGTDVSFNVNAIGPQPLSYQWYFNGTNAVGGATATWLTLANVQATQAGSYSVVVSNAAGSVTSAVAVLTMSPSITTQPTSQTVNAGSTFTVNVAAAGTTPLTYQWRRNGQNVTDSDRITGSTNSELKIVDTDATDAGSYSVVITNICGQVISSNGVLSVNDFAALARWRFDNTNTWVGEQGQLPIATNNLLGVFSWSTNAVLMDNTNAVVVLRYWDVETNGYANISCRKGSIRFWFRPDWTSSYAGGTGLGALGTVGRLIDLGDGTTNGGRWGLFMQQNTNDGFTELCFDSQLNGQTTNYLVTTLYYWLSNDWHQIVLTYSSTNTALYVDGNIVPEVTGPGIQSVPTATARALGLRIGSDQGGGEQAKGRIDELETFNYVLSTNDVRVGYDSDNDGLPDAWELANFGNLDEVAYSSYVGDVQGDYDQDGSDNISEFNSGTDPNTIAFTLTLSASAVSSNSVTAKLMVRSGVPFLMATVVDSTNFASASWTTYSSNINVILSSTEGWHTVWIGLRGRAGDSGQTWQRQRVWVDHTPPLLVITNPAPGSVTSRPMIQVQGWSPEPLFNLRYDLTNAAGITTNQPGFVTWQQPDLTQGLFTTNTFQCFDVGLAPGTNTLWLRAEDQAGNAAETNLVVVLDVNAETNPPAMQVTWPPAGVTLAGSNVTVRGTVDDPTVTITAEIVSTNGTNVVAAVIERHGTFWLEDLPLAAGTNTLRVTATNAGGHTSTSEMQLTNSAVELTLDTNLLGGLWNLNTTVSGAVASGYGVTVNGVAATVDGGNWSATVPMDDEGVATFELTATGSGSTVRRAVYVDKPPVVRIVSYEEHRYAYDGYWELDEWIEEVGEEQISWASRSLSTGWARTNECRTDESWPADVYPASLLGQGTLNCTNVGASTNPISAPPVHGLQCDVYVNTGLFSVSSQTIVERHGLTGWELRTGGRAMAGAISLHQLSLYAVRVLDPWVVTPSSEGIATEPIPGEEVVTPLGSFDSDNRLFVAAPKGAVLNPTPDTAKTASYALTAPSSVGEYRLRIKANGVTLDPAKVASNAKFCVGQQVTFSLAWDQAPQGIQNTNYQWAFGGTYVNDHTNAVPGGSMPDSSDVYFLNSNLLTNALVSNWWLSGAFDQRATYSAKVDVTLTHTNGRQAAIPAEGIFSMHRPEIYLYVRLTPSAVITNQVQFGETNYTGTFLQTSPAGGFLAYIHSAVNGQAGTTQLLKGYATNATFSLTSSNTYALDTAEFYKVLGINPTGLLPVIKDEEGSTTNNTAYVADRPFISCNGHTELHWDSTDYIRFSPNGSNSVFVTLAEWKWHIYATAVPGTTNYSLASTNGYADPYPTDSSNFPRWTNVVTGGIH